jgi:hypothetical protein
MTHYIIALDPAQLRDWSALAVVKMDYVAARERMEYALVALARKQGLPYDKIVDWAVDAWKKPVFWNGCDDDPAFVLDATGVGVAIRDMLIHKNLNPESVMITAGEAYRREVFIYLGKARLIGTFLGAFDAGKVQVNPGLPMWPQLEKEMLSFRAEMSAQGHAKFEAEQGEHDDMLFALALAVWWGESRPRISTWTPPLTKEYAAPDMGVYDGPY